jgi:hypothetical protein
MHAPTASLEAEARPHSLTDTLARAILAGFVASLTMLLVFLVAYNLARLLSVTPTPSWPALVRTSIIHPAEWVAGGAATQTDVLQTPRLWLVNLTHNRLIDAGLDGVYLAAGVYIAGGLLWAVLYSLVEPRLPGSPWQRGVTFALVPALVSLVVVLPLLGGGLFGLALGAGPLPIIGNLLLHAVYGAILGVVYGPAGDLDASTLERPTSYRGAAATSSYERMAALFLVGGLVLGGLAGLAASTLTGGGGAQTLFGDSNGALILGGALLGAVIGLFVGSFLGLGERTHREAER